jgi:hypothetical protein
MRRLRKYITSLLNLGKRSVLSHEFPIVYLTDEVVKATAQLVASFGSSRNPHEGIVYWSGVPTSSTWVITTAIAPEAITTAGSYRTSVSANAYVVKSINELKLQMLAQVHGHPTDWVDHSEGDNRGAFMPYDGFYSIILPWYGRRGMLPLETCGIHRFEAGQFVRLNSDEVKQRFTVVPNSIDLRRTLKASWKKD